MPRNNSTNTVDHDSKHLEIVKMNTHAAQRAVRSLVRDFLNENADTSRPLHLRLGRDDRNSRNGTNGNGNGYERRGNGNGERGKAGALGYGYGRDNGRNGRDGNGRYGTNGRNGNGGGTLMRGGRFDPAMGDPARSAHSNAHTTALQHDALAGAHADAARNSRAPDILAAHRDAEERHLQAAGHYRDAEDAYRRGADQEAAGHLDRAEDTGRLAHAATRNVGGGRL
jgi:hypothetical protein